MLVGVGVQRTQMYSGGNAEVIFQRIMLVRPGKPAVTVFEAPYSSEISIRACFDEKDAKQRLDACSDEYTLQSDLKVEPGEQSGLPNLSLSVLSNRFPRGVSRNADSLAMPALTQDDLIDETDAACTYRRTLAFDAAAGAYKPSAPLPACSEYTVP
ncbi:hypothetical protein V474_14030 [Novosphingobium barchaimii LL02]|uniref:Uncharacterized protein n=1 Tax=Novosphingobium barchaimii LL02 TaxID=1114963 RepID=A0A0J7XX08_9SPHN|nr:hypothetical protein V474_14030 [Novosphingobium barchaimii LL02]